MEQAQTHRDAQSAVDAVDCPVLAARNEGPLLRLGREPAARTSARTPTNKGQPLPPHVRAILGRVEGGPVNIATKQPHSPLRIRQPGGQLAVSCMNEAGCNDKQTTDLECLLLHSRQWCPTLDLGKRNSCQPPTEKQKQPGTRLRGSKLGLKLNRFASPLTCSLWVLMAWQVAASRSSRQASAPLIDERGARELANAVWEALCAIGETAGQL